MSLGLLPCGAALEHGNRKLFGSGVHPDDLLQLLLGGPMGFRIVLALGYVGILNSPSMKAAPASNAAMREPGAALGTRVLAARMSAFVAGRGGVASRRVFGAVIRFHDCNSAGRFVARALALRSTNWSPALVAPPGTDWR